MNQMPPEIISNIVSIILVVILVVSYLRHKKRIDVIKKLDELKTEKKLTQEDKNYLTQNEKEYKEKSEKTEIFAKFLTPVFILISGILFIYLPLTEAMIHFNVIIVAIIYVQLNRINKKNTYILLKELKKDA